MPKNLLTQKQEDFCLEYFASNNATQSYIKAGYSPKTAVVCASRLLTKANICQRLQELRAKAEDATIMGVVERKQRLSEIARAKLTDFMELGQDGSWVNIGPETKYGGAIQEIHSRTEYDENGSKPTVHTSVKLHDPAKAIDLLNKMDKIYSPETLQNVNNIQINIITRDEKAKELVGKIMSGERLLANGHSDAH